MPITKPAQRTTARGEMGGEYKPHVTIDPEWYQGLCSDELLPAVKYKMSWLQREDVTVQQDGAAPPTNKDTPLEFEQVRAEGGGG